MAEPYVGEIALFAINTIPQGWQECKGQLLAIQSNTALYSLIGIQFGGDGKTNFRLPDLRGRAVLGIGVTQTNYSYTMGSYGGTEAVVLNSGNLPTHTHYVVADAANATSVAVGKNFLAKVVTSITDPTPQPLYAQPPTGVSPALVPLNPLAVTATGAGVGHPNIQPSIALTYCIATTGLYPSRP